MDAIEVRSFWRHGSWFPYNLSLKGQTTYFCRRGVYPIATVSGTYNWWTSSNVAYENRDDFLISETEHIVSVRHMNVESEMYPVQLDFIMFKDPELKPAAAENDVSVIEMV